MNGKIKFNTFKYEQNSHRFVENISQCIFLNESFVALIKVSFKYDLQGVMDNKSVVGIGQDRDF